MKLDLELLPHQAEFLTDTTRYIAIVGGYGSGKTRALAYKLLMMAANNSGYEGAALSPTYGMLRRVLVPTIEEILDENHIPYEYKSSTSEITIFFGKAKTKIHLLSAENYKRTAGLNLAFAAVDEADLIQKDIAKAAWRMLSSRLRRGKVYQMAAVSTPEGYNFLYDYFVKEPREKASLGEMRKVIHASTFDNPYLPPEFVQDLLEQYPANLIQAYLHGQFVNLSTGSVYSNFDRKIHHTDLSIDDFDPRAIIHIGVDFNVNNMAAICSVVRDKLVYTINEMIGSKNTESLIKEIKQTYPNRQIMVYPDASGKNQKSNASITDIVLLEQAFGRENVLYPNKNPQVRDRVAAVNARFRTGDNKIHAYVNTNECPKLAAALEQQAYDPKTGAPDKTKGFDHPVDGYGYFIHYRWPILMSGGLKSGVA